LVDHLDTYRETVRRNRGNLEWARYFVTPKVKSPESSSGHVPT
jgi:hypothetical protein